MSAPGMTAEGREGLVQALRDSATGPVADVQAADLIEAQAAEIERLRAALIEIASFDDEVANRNLGETGSYSSFDEPGSVQIARAALTPGDTDV